jgi:photosystem II stability/assembly factor-like uncharacterized protein
MRLLNLCFLGVTVGCVLAVGCAKSDPKPSTTNTNSNTNADAGGGSSGTPPAPTATVPTTGGGVEWKAAVGAGGMMVQTFDERTWETRNTGAGDLFGVACVGNQLGWATGAGGYIGHTTDGGRTWQAQQSGVSSALHAVRFGATTFGVAVGDGGVVLVTHDGGSSWTRASSGTTATLRAVAISQEQGLALVVGDGATALRSDDFGATFHAATIDLAGDLRGVAVDDAAHSAVAVDTAGGLFRSTDLGVSFAREAVAPGALYGVSMDPHGGFAVAVGDSGLVMVRRDQAWARVDSGSSANLRAALVPEDGALDYVAGEHGTLLSHDRASDVWRAIPTHTDVTLFALEDL